MRIGYLVNTYPSGSHTFIRREVQALERQGWTISRFALRASPKPLPDPQDREEHGRTEHILRAGLGPVLLSAARWMARRPRRAWAGARLALRCGGRGDGATPGTGGRLRHLVYLAEAAHLARRCDDQRIPHLHAHFGTNSATIAMLAAEMGGPGFSFTIHGPEEFDAPRALCLGPKAARARFTVVISSFGRSQLLRWTGPETWPRIAVVHCGVEPWRFGAPEPPPPAGPHLVAIGRLAEQKGFDLLIEAAARAVPAAPGLRLTLVGDGELRPRLEAAVARQGLGGHVAFAGWLDEAGVRAALRAAQALVLPSFAEGLPVVLMEAMAAGRPVIATAIAGVPELVTPETGWLVPAGDPEALARAMVALAALPPQRLGEMGAAARRRVLDRHDVDAEARKLGRLFAAQVGGRIPRGEEEAPEEPAPPGAAAAMAKPRLLA